MPCILSPALSIGVAQLWLYILLSDAHLSTQAIYAAAHQKPLVAMQHFDAMDEHGQKMQDLESALGLASAFERYNQAADLKKELEYLNANDVVEAILEVTVLPLPHQCSWRQCHLSVSPCVHSKV